MKSTIPIQCTCPSCGSQSIVFIPYEGYTKWIEGELIQKAMPTVSEEIREVLISGICPKCQEKFFN